MRPAPRGAAAVLFRCKFGVRFRIEPLLPRRYPRILNAVLAGGFMSFSVQPIPIAIADYVRGQLRSPQYGHPAHRDRAAGLGPCRLCFEPFRVGEEDRILFTFNPFLDGCTLASPGPIFIHAEHCQPFADDGLPPGLRTLPLVIEPLDAVGLPVWRTNAKGMDVDDTIRVAFDNPAVARLLIRHGEAGCFIALVTRDNHPSFT